MDGLLSATSSSVTYVSDLWQDLNANMLKLQRVNTLEPQPGPRARLTARNDPHEVIQMRVTFCSVSRARLRNLYDVCKLTLLRPTAPPSPTSRSPHNVRLHHRNILTKMRFAHCQMLRASRLPLRGLLSRMRRGMWASQLTA